MTAQETAQAPVVEAPAGSYRGLAGDVERFLGIDYAKPPIGQLRWRPPQPIAAKSGITDATDFGCDCPQAPFHFSRAPGQSEECLSLNIWRPTNSESKALPVYLWLHGGGYAGGSSSDARTDGAALARRGIIVVTANYRTGIFGFFAHPALSEEGDGHSGNYGLMDAIAALHWVHVNIAAFGGDPERITLGGVSAGAASAALMLIARDAATLPYRQMILESPGCMRPLATLDEAESRGVALGKDIALLRTMPPAELMKLLPAYAGSGRSLTRSRVSRPIIDGKLIIENEEPAHRAGRARNVPMLIGSNRDEGAQLAAKLDVRDATAYEHLLQAEFGEYSQEALKLYQASGGHDIIRQLGQLYGDTQFTYGAYRLAGFVATHAPVYRYLFAYREPEQTQGPFHGDEPPYAFGNPARSSGMKLRPDSPQSNALTASMADMWARFISDGSPGWQECDNNALPLHILDSTFSTAYSWRASQMAFLTKFFA